MSNLFQYFDQILLGFSEIRIGSAAADQNAWAEHLQSVVSGFQFVGRVNDIIFFFLS